MCEVYMKVTSKERLLLLSMVLGDGSINKNGYFSVRHCLAQEEYIKWKYCLLSGSIKLSEIYYVSNNGYGSFEFRTKVYKFIKRYRNIIYSNGGKKLSHLRFLNKLEPLHLAIWYMDDGSLTQKKRNGLIHANELYINTYISKDENQLLIDYFKEKWSIYFHQSKNKGKYRLRCSTREARKFLKIVEPYVSQVKCMKHKLAVKGGINFTSGFPE